MMRKCIVSKSLLLCNRLCLSITA